jgi:hypothetical protein
LANAAAEERKKIKKISKPPLIKQKKQLKTDV